MDRKNTYMFPVWMPILGLLGAALGNLVALATLLHFMVVAPMGVRFDAMDARMGVFAAQVTALSEKVAGVDKRLYGVEIRLAQVTGKSPEQETASK